MVTGRAAAMVLTGDLVNHHRNPKKHQQAFEECICAAIVQPDHSLGHSMATFSIDGFDPLSIEYSSEENETLLDQANRRIILNILKSYTGYFDIFSETLQNAFDATEAKLREAGEGYEPKIWIEIDIENARVRVTDNGVGISAEEYR